MRRRFVSGRQKQENEVEPKNVSKVYDRGGSVRNGKVSPGLVQLAQDN